MSGPRTLAVVRSLEEAGFHVWTPTETLDRRQSRSRKRRTVQHPILPTFAFADYMELPDLLIASLSPVSQHPAFTVFKHGDGFPRIADAALEGLRHFEKEARLRAAKGAPKRRLTGGQHVRAPDTAFDGMQGTVIETSKGNGNLVLVAFPGFTIPVKISSWHLRPVQLNDAEPEQGKAPRVANGK